ncbi:MAG: four-carbon acid sugar kinase family protein [Cyclobacteriaceae bacterium]|nr:four-carbon acid sugar kinase family protein [Cyclobacteriaceae bacterium]
MPKILVIADDFTGAAEMGGIAHLYGFRVKFISNPTWPKAFAEDVLVLDTDSRNLNGEDAATKVQKFVSGFQPEDFSLIYKKTDSVLRGQVEAEIKALLKWTGFSGSVLAPANPSKRRTIVNGHYLIDGQPIHETDFLLDPIYPRRHSEVVRLLGDHVEATHANDFSHNTGIIIPDVLSIDQLNGLLSTISLDNCLLSGGADFFRSVLTTKLQLGEQAKYNTNQISGARCFIIGSTSNSSRQTVQRLQEQGLPLLSLPRAGLYDQVVFRSWLDHIKSNLKNELGLVVSSPAEHITDPADKKNITKRLASAGKFILQNGSQHKHLFVEGGETARAIMDEAEVPDLRLDGVLADGVVRFWSDRYHFI